LKRCVLWQGFCVSHSLLLPWLILEKSYSPRASPAERFLLQLNESHGYLRSLSQQEELRVWRELLVPLVFRAAWKRLTHSLNTPQLRVSCHFNLNEAGRCIERGHQRCWQPLSWALLADICIFVIFFCLRNIWIDILVPINKWPLLT